MKFAKELEQELVPEWRLKYLDYKIGKKKIKAIARALQKENRNPQLPAYRRATTTATTTFGSGDQQQFTTSAHPHDATRSPATAASNANNPSIRRSILSPRTERQPLKSPRARLRASPGNYGSIVSSPRDAPQTSDLASLSLPEPAIDSNEPASRLTPRLTPVGSSREGGHLRRPSPGASKPAASVAGAAAADAGDGDSKASLQVGSGGGSPRNSTLKEGGGTSHLQTTPSVRPRSAFLKRMFSQPDGGFQGKGLHGEPATEHEQRQDEFFAFLDGELSKIETFYRTKEEEATNRLRTLRTQLHIMGDQRIKEVLAAKNSSDLNNNNSNNNNDSNNKRARTTSQFSSSGFIGVNNASSKLTRPIMSRNNFGKNSEALPHLASPAAFMPHSPKSVVNRRDFSRRPEPPPTAEVPYRSAKKKLKHALQEYYRGLELLKSYAYLNRTAFRKINKKYDKVTVSRPPMRYMSDKVNHAWFVQSEVVDHLMTTAEDLYTRYFERGNHKIAVSKLRHRGQRPGDYSSNTFRSGLLLMGGALFAIHGLADAQLRIHEHGVGVEIHGQTLYLLQIYAGFFQIILHFLLFCFDCIIWTKAKINYVFVFEFDTRHALDWRQLLELPSLCFFLLGLFMWLNFAWVNAMYVYWPVVLVTILLIIQFVPARVLYFRSRKWWAYSNWRLLLSGFYPVEFRDFFLGDMYCSETYSMGNIALFFCLYAKHWKVPDACNSSHSRLLGFFSCLPAVWRAFQCLRRFADTRSYFPHLLNFGKYIFTILYYMTLSMYRINKETRYLAPFVTFALLNAIYTSIWDIAMDWSLCNPYARHPFLRETLAFRRPWVYYVSILADITVRFNWIFYAIFTSHVQQSQTLSFFVSFTEVCRRGLWTLFRVENEHCTNVHLSRASRDLPLPYDFPPRTSPEHHPSQDMQLEDRPADTDTPHTAPQVPPAPAPGDVEQGTPVSVSGTPGHGHGHGHARRPRRPSIAEGFSRMGSMVATAHAQDFQRKRNPDALTGAEVRESPGTHREDDSSDDEEEAEDAGQDEYYADRAMEEGGVENELSEGEGDVGTHMHASSGENQSRIEE